MVAHRSPKPPVRVRILLPLPTYSGAINMEVFMFNSFFKFYILICIILVVFCSIFIPILALDNNADFILTSNGSFFWPTPRLYRNKFIFWL